MSIYIFITRQNVKNELITLDFVTSDREFIMSQRRNWRAKFWIFRRFVASSSNIDILVPNFRKIWETEALIKTLNKIEQISRELTYFDFVIIVRN